MRPRIQLLTPELIGCILCEAFELLMSPGVRVGSAPVVELLRSAGVEVNDGVARVPEPLVRNCLASAPPDFYLYNRQGENAVHYGGDDVHFDWVVKVMDIVRERVAFQNGAQQVTTLFPDVSLSDYLVDTEA